MRRSFLLAFGMALCLGSSWAIRVGLSQVAPQAAGKTTAAPTKPSGAPAKSAGPEAAGGLKPLPAEAWNQSAAQHLLRRAGFGGTLEEAAKLHALGLHKAVDSLVDFRQQQGWHLPLDVAPLERPKIARDGLPPQEERRLREERRKADVAQMERLRAWWVERMIHSPRPLEEKLVLFWHGHFATEYQVVRDSQALYLQNQLFREHAAGNFGDLLHGIVHDAAMLRYLDNNRNVRGRPNENLAREIMELFSLGEGNYTEQDIREAARALTGYTVEPGTSKFRFAATQHDPENKTIFRKTGRYGGDDLVDLLLQQPAASKFITGKLFAYFAYENPSAEVVDQLAAVLRRHNYELAPVLKNIFTSEEFYSQRAVGTRIKSPIELVVGTYRALGITEGDYRAMYEAARNMGQNLFQPPNVKGWLGQRDWVNSRHLFVRYNALANLIEAAPRDKSKAGLDLVAVLKRQEFQGGAEVVDYLARTLLAVPLDDAKRQALVELVNADEPLPPSEQWAARRALVNARLRAALVLFVCTPEYQMN